MCGPTSAVAKPFERTVTGGPLGIAMMPHTTAFHFWAFEATKTAVGRLMICGVTTRLHRFKGAACVADVIQGLAEEQGSAQLAGMSEVLRVTVIGAHAWGCQCPVLWGSILMHEIS